MSVSSNELITNLIEIRMAMEHVEDNTEAQQALAEQETIIVNFLEKKVDNIDNFILSLKDKVATLDAKLLVFKEEIDRINRRKNTLENITKRFNHFILPMIIDEIGKDGRLETSTAKYTAFETWKVDEWIEEELPEKYHIKQEIIKFDKIQAKKDAIKAIEEGMELKGCRLKRERNVRRS